MNNKISLPVAIVVSGVVVALAIMFTKTDTSIPKNPVSDVEQTKTQNSISLDNVNPIEDDEHILGDINAPIKIVEYSDFECPFCKRFHSTMNQIIEDYIEEGSVAWVYRHFPLDQLHPVKARKEAVASECVTEQKGNEGFWKFTDLFFSKSPSNNRTDLDTVLSEIVVEMELDEQKFNECLESGRYDSKIQEDIDNAISTGGQGTPWSILITEDGKKIPINGAQPYESVKLLIENNL